MTVREYIHIELNGRSLGTLIEAKASGLNLNQKVEELSSVDRKLLRYLLISQNPPPPPVFFFTQNLLAHE
jgi:hypothetical protein